MSYTAQEKAYYDSLFSVIDKDQSGVLPGQDALPFLVSSGLPQQVLGEVWALADPDNNGFLTKDSWYRAARLIGHMQRGGTQVEESLTTKSGPLPTFAGHQPPISAQTTGSLPPLTAADRAKFTKIFVGCGPQNGLVSGDKARDVFLKSQLNYDKLGQIWTLADTKQRGSLDLPDFIIGMYLIQSCMANSALTLPQSLPPSVYEQASGGRSPISPIRQTPASPIRPQYAGMQQSGLQPQYTGQRQLQPQSTGQRLQPQGTGQPWDITPDAKATSDRFFAQLDPQNKGVIEGDVAVPFMLQSQLDETALASIWDLADIRKEGKLTKDEFAVAMHLINGKLAGRDVPSVLPASLIPPSLRSEFGQQEVLTEPSSTAKDLFDLFADDPPAPAPAPAPAPFAPSAFLPPSRKGTAPPPPAPRALSPVPTGGSNYSGFASRMAPPADLLGEDSASPASVPDNSAEIGNKQNQLAATQRSNSELEKQRGDLEKTAASTAAELERLEQRLSSARVKHEAESKSVEDLRNRVSEQQTTIKSLNTDLISAESDLSAMRSEKDELEQALLHDKEEVRGLQRRMKEVEDEKTGLKLVLEKMKKEARQQKGMVTIAKKQLATAEGSRDSLQNEIKAEEASPSPAAVPLPATPQALSPAQTGMSQRSNNPFDRLRNATSPTPSEQGPGTAALFGAGAVVGAAAGVVAAGASTLYEAAKEVVSPEDSTSAAPNTPPAESAPESALAQAATSEPAPVEREVADDPFGAADEPQAQQQSERQVQHEVDPFGVPSSGARFDQTFDDGFGDSFTQPAQPKAQPESNNFDSDFDSFDPPKSQSVPEASPERTETSDPAREHLSEGIPSGIPKSAIPYLRPESERTVSTQAVAAESAPDSPVARDDASSDEDEGPEDLEQPRIKPNVSGSAREMSPAPTGDESKTRRSAPPPPVKSPLAAPIDDFDPFGAPQVPSSMSFGSSAQSQSTFHTAPSFGSPSQATTIPEPTQLPPGAAPPQPQTVFDEDDFDFSDQPPVRVDDSHQPPQSFKDDFDFDDEFDKPSTGQGSEGSNGMSKSYEMVSPPSDAFSAPPPSKPSTFSFDDAFGGDFEPAPQTFQPPAGPPPRDTLAAPPLPVRRDSEAQADDIEDVKKLCGMGFSRSLVIEALAANSYDFQKTLNVLLQ